MPDPATLKAIADVGGWVFAAFILAGTLVVFLRAVQSGDLVSGATHRGVVAQNDKLSEALSMNTATLNTFATQTTATLKELRDDVAELRGLRRRD